MKANPQKLSDLLHKQKEETPPPDNQRNLPYLLKKRKESECNNNIEKIQNNAKNKISEDDKNIKALGLRQ